MTMSLAEDLRSVLERVSQALHANGVHDVAVIASEAASILGLHITSGEVEVAEDAAIRLIDHLFRGSAAAGALQSMPPPPAAEAEPDPAAEAASTPPESSPESSAPDEPESAAEPPEAAPGAEDAAAPPDRDTPVQVTTAAIPAEEPQPEPDEHMATPAEVTGATSE